MPSISGQLIVAVGGSSGIGLAVTKLAAADGVHIAIVSSNPTRIAAAVETLKEKAPNIRITGYVCDLRKEDVEARLEKVFTDVIADNEGHLIDHIIFTAGTEVATKPLKEINIDLIRKAGHVRFVVPLLVGKLAPRFLKNNFTSSIVLTTGSAAEKPVSEWSIIASYASGLLAMTRSLALELRPIRVNIVSPGAVDTELWRSNPEMLAAFAKTAFMGRVCQAEEVAEAYIYLMKDTNATGSVVNTNGGILL
jgi:NAD(P)-dependent dehydrogenase (short-subunit alcohol dehydrogenase family)